MIKQSKISKICWALVYLFPLVLYCLVNFLWTNESWFWNTSFADIFEFLPHLDLQLFSSQPLTALIPFDNGLILDKYLGYLVLLSLFRIIWKVLVYLPDVVGKLIDRWSL